MIESYYCRVETLPSKFLLTRSSPWSSPSLPNGFRPTIHWQRCLQHGQFPTCITCHTSERSFILHVDNFRDPALFLGRGLQTRTFHRLVQPPYIVYDEHGTQAMYPRHPPGKSINVTMSPCDHLHAGYAAVAPFFVTRPPFPCLFAVPEAPPFLPPFFFPKFFCINRMNTSVSHPRLIYYLDYIYLVRNGDTPCLPFLGE